MLERVKSLALILSDTELVAEVRALAPRALAEIVARVGLEDAAELVALASTEQLLGVFDEDLWASAAPGVDETFDDARFAVWLEILGEAGDEHVARRFVELPEDFLILALSRRLFVFDEGALAAATDDDPRIDKALASSLTHELGTWILVAREHDGWDVLLAALATIDRDDHDLLERVLDRVAGATEARAEDEGLYEVLSEAETLAEDVAAEREERRARQGFLAPSAAAAFLKLARRTSLDELLRMTSDPITRAYFRDVDASAPPPAPSRLRELLELAPRRLPPARKRTKFAAAVDALEPGARGKVYEELAYLTNVLVAAEGLRPLEAAERVMQACQRGFVRTHSAADAVKAFRVGWHLAST